MGRRRQRASFIPYVLEMASVALMISGLPSLIAGLYRVKWNEYTCFWTLYSLR